MEIIVDREDIFKELLDMYFDKESVDLVSNALFDLWSASLEKDHYEDMAKMIDETNVMRGALRQIADMKFIGEGDPDANIYLNNAISVARDVVYGKDWDEWMKD